MLGVVARLGFIARALFFRLRNDLADHLVAGDDKPAHLEDARFVGAASSIEVDAQVHGAASYRWVETNQAESGACVCRIRDQHARIMAPLIDMNGDRSL